MKKPLPFLGHENIMTSLREAQTAGRLPHALLFVGPEGIGKQKVARHLARGILCEKPGGPCDECRACLLSSEMKHPDLIWVEPVEEKIKIDTVREMKKELAFPPMMGSSRIIVFNDAHTLNASAANALLKSLEEPRGGTFFILITHALGWIPRTIVSRSHKIPFAPLSPDQVKRILAELKLNLPEAFVLRAQGSPLQAMALSEIQGRVPEIKALLPGPKAMGFEEAFELAQSAVEAGRVPAFLHALLSSAHESLTGDQGEEAWEFDLLNFTDRILEIKRLLRQNINPKIHLTRLLLYFQEPQESRL
jgi:DNA polymerase III delta' subunit